MLGDGVMKNNNKLEKDTWLYKYENNGLYPIMMINHEYQRVIYGINNPEDRLYTLCKVEFDKNNPEEFSVEDIYSIQIPGNIQNPMMKMYISSEVNSPFVYIVVKNTDGVIVAEQNYLVGNSEACCMENEQLSSVGNEKESDLKHLEKYDSGVQSVECILAKLNNMPGLNDIKKQVKNLIECIQLEKVRVDNGLSPLGIFPGHLVFCGNPGTGKTTVARILAELYYSLGVIKENKLVEVDRSGLVVGYVGQTAQKTKQVIESALGGVLFIDEAYTLSKDGNDFGQEAIDTLLKAMEDYREDLIVIVAGYPEKMSKFIYSNPGLKSRFKKFINFSDYSGEELYEIFTMFCKKNNMIVEESSIDDLKKFFNKMSKNKGPYFANGREVRNYYETVIQHQAHRIAYCNPSVTELSLITRDDLEIDNSVENQNAALNELNWMIGLKNAKSEIKEFISLVNTQLQREEKGLLNKTINYHMVFEGRPGTGKTTVARLVAKIMKNLGIITEDKLVEVDASDLISGYVGQSALKTTDVINSALGGVLFIDEAYGLSRSSFGEEVTDTLLRAMENYRDNFVVIVAGYENEMKSYIDSNPGLKSRFSTFIHFDDYSSEELLQIFIQYCMQEQYKLDLDAESVLTSFIYENMNKFKSNGRDVRNLFELVKKQQAKRLFDNENSADDLIRITMSDIDAAITKYAQRL